MIEGERLDREDINGGLESPGEDKFRQCLKVNHMRPADQDQECAGLNELEQLSREQGFILRSGYGQNKDDFRAGQKLVQWFGFDPVAAEIAVPEPGIINGERAAEGRQQGAEGLGQVPEADQANGLAI